MATSLVNEEQLEIEALPNIQAELVVCAIQVRRSVVELRDFLVSLRRLSIPWETYVPRR